MFFSYNLSFRKPREDTCGKCDSLKIVLSHSSDADEITETKTLQETHWRDVQKHYDENYFDFNVLWEMKNNHDLDWRMPPTWRQHSREPVIVNQRLHVF